MLPVVVPIRVDDPTAAEGDLVTILVHRTPISEEEYRAPLPEPVVFRVIEDDGERGDT